MWRCWTDSRSVQFSLSVLSDPFPPHGLLHGQASLSITNSRSMFKLMSIPMVMPSNHLIFCRPLLPPSIFPSISSNELVLHIRWPKYWMEFQLQPSVLPMNIQPLEASALRTRSHGWGELGVLLAFHFRTSTPLLGLHSMASHRPPDPRNGAVIRSATPETPWPDHVLQALPAGKMKAHLRCI